MSAPVPAAPPAPRAPQSDEMKITFVPETGMTRYDIPATGEGEAPTPVMLDDLTRRINELHAFLSSDNASGDFGRALESRVSLAHRILRDFATLRAVLLKNGALGEALSA